MSIIIFMYMYACLYNMQRVKLIGFLKDIDLNI